MSDIFLRLVNMSISAGWLVLAIILLRLVFKKAPKWIFGILWGFVALRLVFPFSLESIFSLIPSKETFPSDFTSGYQVEISSGINFVDSTVNSYFSDNYFEGVTAPIENKISIIAIFTVVWLIGVILMLVYTYVSYARIKKQTSEAILLSDNVYICDRIPSPFILGIIKPKIYLPSSLSEEDTKYVLLHENAHIKRSDHLIKPFGFLLLAIYWFNPILWIAYILLCKDIELACDEKVIKSCGSEIKKNYSEVLINCSVKRKMISACPLAFGEVGVKERVKSVLNYKKPTFGIIILSVIIIIVTAVCFLTNPKTNDNDENPTQSSNTLPSFTPEDDRDYLEGLAVSDDQLYFAGREIKEISNAPFGGEGGYMGTDENGQPTYGITTQMIIPESFGSLIKLNSFRAYSYATSGGVNIAIIKAKFKKYSALSDSRIVYESNGKTLIFDFNSNGTVTKAYTISPSGILNCYPGTIENPLE